MFSTRGGGGGMGMGGGGGMNGMFQSVFGGFNEMFSNFQNAAPKDPIQKTIKLSVAEVFKGGSRDISIEIMEKCKECLGTGTGSKVKCADCDGNGIRVNQTRSGNTLHIQRIGCTTCGGRGGIGVGADRPCGVCMGHRQKASITTKKITIPRAIPDNTRITVNEGDRPTILIIKHPPNTDPDWKGWDLLSTRDLKYMITISLEDALLGSTREVTLPNEGVLSFAIPSGIQPGNTLRITDKGLPSCPEAKLPPSSILIQVNVTLPTIPEKHKEHTRKFFTLLSSSSS
jgi:molecular chaperone DnaJ